MASIDAPAKGSLFVWSIGLTAVLAASAFVCRREGFLGLGVTSSSIFLADLPKERLFAPVVVVGFVVGNVSAATASTFFEVRFVPAFVTAPTWISAAESAPSVPTFVFFADAEVAVVAGLRGAAVVEDFRADAVAGDSAAVFDFVAVVRRSALRRSAAGFVADFDVAVASEGLRRSVFRRSVAAFLMGGGLLLDSTTPL